MVVALSLTLFVACFAILVAALGAKYEITLKVEDEPDYVGESESNGGRFSKLQGDYGKH